MFGLSRFSWRSVRRSRRARQGRVARRFRCESLEDRRLLAAVISTSPVAGSMAAPDVEIQATYDMPLDAATVTDSTFVVHRAQVGRLTTPSGDIDSLTTSGATIALDPANNFLPGELVQVSATSGIRTAAGPATNPFVWEFQAAVTKATSGSFSDSGQLLGSANSQGVSLGDLDGDGDLDAFVANSSGPDEVWLNQGGFQGGTLGAFVDSGQALGNAASVRAALGDLDGDGDLDAIVVSFLESNRVWINQGGLQAGVEGTFADSGQSFGNSDSIDISLGDLDGDGDLDAFVANFNQPDQVWMNQGGLQGGTAGMFTVTGSMGSSPSVGVSLGDLDGDGDLDAFIVNHNQPNFVWLNQGGLQGGIVGTFADSGQRLGNSAGTDVALGDIDGDGDLDAFVTSNNQSSRIWLNQGGIQGGVAGNFADSGQSLGDFSSFGISLNDVDGDGDLDAFVANFEHPDMIWVNQGGVQGGLIGTFAVSGQLLGTSQSAGIAMGDVDLDGDLDAFVANFGSNLVWINQNDALPPLIGDYNGNGSVDAADYAVWRKTLGQTGLVPFSGADGDGDGEITQNDYSIWRANFGRSLPQSASIASGSDQITNVEATPVQIELVPRLQLTAANEQTDSDNVTTFFPRMHHVASGPYLAVGMAMSSTNEPTASTASGAELLLLALSHDAAGGEHSESLLPVTGDDERQQHVDAIRDEVFFNWPDTIAIEL